MLEHENADLSVRKQCELLSIPRSTLYYHTIKGNSNKKKLMNKIDEMLTKYPFFGYRRVTAMLKREGWLVNRKRIYRLMGEMGLQAIYPKPKTTLRNKEHNVYPYLLKQVAITKSNQVWATDITYIRTRDGFVYLVAIMDWYSRYILSWDISSSLETSFCIKTLEKALLKGKPAIFNSDQGCQFTSKEFTNILKQEGIRISMVGKGRCMDNIFTERFWRSVKYEDMYLKEYVSHSHAEREIHEYIKFYNNQRPHQSLQYKTPEEVYCKDRAGGRNLSLA